MTLQTLITSLITVSLFSGCSGSSDGNRAAARPTLEADKNPVVPGSVATDSDPVWQATTKSETDVKTELLAGFIGSWRGQRSNTYISAAIDKADRLEFQISSSALAANSSSGGVITDNYFGGKSFWFSLGRSEPDASSYAIYSSCGRDQKSIYIAGSITSEVLILNEVKYDDCDSYSNSQGHWDLALYSKGAITLNRPNNFNDHRVSELIKRN